VAWLALKFWADFSARLFRAVILPNLFIHNEIGFHPCDICRQPHGVIKKSKQLHKETRNLYNKLDSIAARENALWFPHRGCGIKYRMHGMKRELQKLEMEPLDARPAISSYFAGRIAPM